MISRKSMMWMVLKQSQCQSFDSSTKVLIVSGSQSDRRANEEKFPALHIGVLSFRDYLACLFALLTLFIGSDLYLSVLTMWRKCQCPNERRDTWNVERVCFHAKRPWTSTLVPLAPIRDKGNGSISIKSSRSSIHSDNEGPRHFQELRRSGPFLCHRVTVLKGCRSWFPSNSSVENPLTDRNARGFASTILQDITGIRK